MIDQVQILKDLSDASAPSGREKAVRTIVSTVLKKHAIDYTIDRSGNLIVTRGNSSHLLITAHMDEIGFIITEISDDGTLRFDRIGGIDLSHLASKRVVVGEEKIHGIIGSIPVHFKKQANELISPSDFYIDIGAKDKKEALQYVSVGDVAVFDTEFDITPNNKDYLLKGKALDNRLGCFLLLMLLTMSDCEGTFVFSVKEETGLCGALALKKTRPYELTIALDTTTANDLPCVSSPSAICSLGKGPVISFADAASIYDHTLIAKIFDYLSDLSIPAQTKSGRTGGNEASAHQMNINSSRVVSISIPCRYIHSSMGMALYSDLDATYRAIQAIISTEISEVLYDSKN